MTFQLNPRLAADTIPLGDLALCRVLLMNDRQYPWIVLVPRQPDLEELTDLGAADRHLLMEEIALVASVLDEEASPVKINVGALGNIVRQLHIHVIARRTDDPAWPGPVWGKVPAIAYEISDAEALCRRLSSRLGL